MLIDQLPEITDANDADEMPIEQGTTTRKIKILNLLKNCLKLTGGTLTGNLIVNKTSPGFEARISNLEDGIAPSSATNQFGFRIRDKNNSNIALFTDRWNASGAQGAWMAGYRLGVANSLYLQIDSDGNPIVSLTSPAAWRSALGLGTNGVLPITIAQGGTGATTAATAKANLGLDRLNAIQYSGANGATVNIPLNSSESGFIVCSGAANSARELIWFNCTSTGTASVTRLRNVSDGLTVTASTNKIAIANASGAYVYCLKFSY